MANLILSAKDVNFEHVKKLIGNSLDLLVFDVDNGATIKAQIKTTTRAGLVKTARLHATIISPNGFWEYYKETKDGGYTRVDCGHSAA